MLFRTSMTHDAVSKALTTEHDEELFRKLLIPEIFSKILRHLKPKDRLNMRQCCRDTEDAVARSDMHIEHITSIYLPFGLHLGLKKDRTTLKLRQDNGHDLEEIARVRERLFARVYTKYVIVYIKFVPIAIVARILEGCIFEELDMTISHYKKMADVFEYLKNMDLKRCEKIKLSLTTAIENAQRLLSLYKGLLSLKPLRSLEMRNTATHLSEEVLVEMVKRRHAYMDLPVVVVMEQAIIDIRKASGIAIIECNPDAQVVKFAVCNHAVERFMLIMGFRMTRDRRKRDAPFKHVVKLRKNSLQDAAEREQVKMKILKDSDNKWCGFHLDFGRVHILARQNLSDSRLDFEISNCFLEEGEEEEEQSSDDENTKYF